MHDVCLLLGSNIQPEQNLLKGLKLLAGKLTIGAVSHIWETAAVGSEGPNFLNAAVLAQTHLNSLTLKETVLRPIETHLGRVRTKDKNAPRPIDIDVVWWDGQPIDPDLTRYAHIAVPVAEVLPGLQLEMQGYSLTHIANRLRRTETIHQRSDLRF